MLETKYSYSLRVTKLPDFMVQKNSLFSYIGYIQQKLKKKIPMSRPHYNYKPIYTRTANFVLVCDEFEMMT